MPATVSSRQAFYPGWPFGSFVNETGSFQSSVNGALLNETAAPSTRNNVLSVTKAAIALSSQTVTLTKTVATAAASNTLNVTSASMALAPQTVALTKTAASASAPNGPRQAFYPGWPFGSFVNENSNAQFAIPGALLNATPQTRSNVLAVTSSRLAFAPQTVALTAHSTRNTVAVTAASLAMQPGNVTLTKTGAPVPLGAPSRFALGLGLSIAFGTSLLAGGSAIANTLSASTSSLAIATASVSLTSSVAGSLLPAGSTIIMAGDSITAHGNSSVSGTNAMNIIDAGELHLAKMLLPSFRYDNWHNDSDPNGRSWTGANHGKSGDTPSGLLSRINAAIAMQPALMIVAIGVNGITDFASASQIYDAVLSAKIPLIVFGVRPWSATKSGDSPSSHTTRLAYNSQNKTYVANANASGGKAQINGVPCDYFDPDPIYDPNGTGNGPTSWYWPDGLHPNSLAASTVAPALLQMVSKYVTPSNWLVSQYWNAGGNLAPNPTFTGSSGTVGTGITGQMPTGYQIRQVGSSTAVASLVANTDTGGQSIRLDTTAVGTSVSERFEILISSSSTGLISTGDLTGRQLQAFMEVYTDGNPMWGIPSLYIQSPTSAAQRNIGGQTVTPPLNIAAAPQTWWVATDPFPAPSGDTGINLILQGHLNPSTATTGGAMIFKRVWLGIVPDPKPLYHS